MDNMHLAHIIDHAEGSHAATADDIAGRYQAILNQVGQCEQRWGRAPGSVLLLAVSKTHPPSRLQQAYAAGARHFGENYLQEALQKIDALSSADSGTPDIVWHFIGPVQSNKTRDIAGHFHWLHSIDRVRIAQRLDAQRPAHLPPLNVCVQVNLSVEETKSGVALSEVQALCAVIDKLTNIRLRGLMAIPAPEPDFERQRAAFRVLHEAFQSLTEQFPSMDTLSIGMSDDFDAAIAEGSTMIRIGTAIFGSRLPAAGSAQSNKR